MPRSIKGPTTSRKRLSSDLSEKPDSLELADLEAELAEGMWVKGAGEHPVGDWPSEPSVLVLGISREKPRRSAGATNRTRDLERRGRLASAALAALISGPFRTADGQPNSDRLRPWSGA